MKHVVKGSSVVMRPRKGSDTVMINSCRSALRVRLSKNGSARKSSVCKVAPLNLQ
jgi:hypothetical protein